MDIIYLKHLKESFICNIVDIEQEAINQKFNEYLSTNILNAKQQEFVKCYQRFT